MGKHEIFSTLLWETDPERSGICKILQQRVEREHIQELLKMLKYFVSGKSTYYKTCPDSKQIAAIIFSDIKNLCCKVNLYLIL